MLHFFTTALGRLRLVGFAEGLSFLILLFVAMPLKYVWGQPEAVRSFGSVHGLLFVLYVLLVFQNKAEHGWDNRRAWLLLLLSVLPFGTFYADAKLLRNK
jgi:integral membrane protein